MDGAGSAGVLSGASSSEIYAYDGLNRRTSVTDGANNQTQYAYDAAGNLVSETNPLNYTTSYTYDAQHRLLTQTTPLNGTTTYAYDLGGRNTSITDPDSNQTRMSYDKDGRVTSTTNPMGYTATNQYDADGRLTSTTDANGRTSNFSYDSGGEQTGETWLNSTNQVVYTATYNYDAAGQLTGESDPVSAYTDQYDAAGRLTQQTVTYPGLSSSPLVTLTYSYNNVNDRTGLSDSLGGVASYTFDADHHLTGAQLTVSGVGASVTLSYDSFNRLSGATRTLVGGFGGHTITSTNTYDGAGRLTRLFYQDTTANSVLANYTYGFDASSELTSYTGPEGSLTYAYDHTGQLTGASGTVNGQSYAASYSYDLNGDRTMTGYQTGTGNELLNDGTYSYTYDHAGNLLTRTDASGNVWSNTWDYHNRLTEVVEKNSQGTTLQDEKFTYDVEDRLIQVTLNGVTQRWTVYDGANANMDLNASGQVTMRYLTNPGALEQFLARVDPTGNVGWYLTDRLWSVRQVVSGTGAILDQVTYDAYGNILSESNAGNGDRFKYAGGAYDALQGTYLDGARWYGPGNGRFDSQDPLGFDGGDANLYRYAANDPTGNVDPSGMLYWLPVLTGARAAAGVASGTGAAATGGGAVTLMAVGLILLPAAVVATVVVVTNTGGVTDFLGHLYIDLGFESATLSKPWPRIPPIKVIPPITITRPIRPRPRPPKKRCYCWLRFKSGQEVYYPGATNRDECDLAARRYGAVKWWCSSGPGTPFPRPPRGPS